MKGDLLVTPRELMGHVLADHDVRLIHGGDGKIFVVCQHMSCQWSPNGRDRVEVKR